MKRNAAFLLFFLLFLSSCSPWKEVRVTDPRLDKLEWSSKEKADEGGPRAVDIWVRVKVENPNRHAFKVVGSDLDLYLDEKDVGDAELQEKVKIPGKSSKKHRFHVKAELRDLASGGLKALGSVIGGSAPEIRIKGTVKGRAHGVFTKKFEVDESKRINIGRMMGQRSSSRSSITR